MTATLPQRKVATYGWRRDTPDPRDYGLHQEKLEVPSRVDLRETGHLPPVFNQSALGSCTANAIAGAFEYEANRQGEGFDTPSRLFIYWNERYIEGTTDQDAGAEIRDGIKVVAKLGAPPETDWPYDIERFAERPPDKAFGDGAQHLAIRYARVNPSLHSKKCALAGGLPVVFGFTVYPEFESPEVAQTGVVPMPDLSNEPVGGHAVAAVGYDDAAQVFIVRNSWGPEFGQGGYVTMPYAYLLDQSLASDFWTISAVS